MIYLNEGDSTEIQGSGKNPYKIRKIGGVVDCSCPAWRNLGGSIDNRVCKHIKANIDPACLLPQAQIKAVGNASPTATKASSSNTSAVVAPPLLLAHTWDESIDPTGWWMSDKMDGVRAMWDGVKFISRLGNEYHAPKFFLDAMPEGVKLDGELYSGPGKFQETVSAVRKLVPNDQEWCNVTYVVFDLLNSDEPFEDRQDALQEMMPSCTNPNIWTLARQKMCASRKDLQDKLKQVEALKIEGVMLRAPGSKYEAGRSHSLLKVKTFFDAEAVVTGMLPGKGKHKGRMGALQCQTETGVSFDVGSGFTDKQRESPPALGTRITYRYQELTRDSVPRFPTFLRVYEAL